MLECYSLLLVFPLLGAAINGILGKRLPPWLISLVGCGTVFLSFSTAAVAFFELLRLPAGERVVVQELFTWIESGSFVARASFLFDPLSAVMILVVTGVSFLIHVYSIEYMKGEAGYYRYFSYLNLFVFMMSILVLADNFLLMFIGWEGVGLCSYLLIGYYFETRVAGDAAKKAFIVNRIGDFGFLLAVFLIFTTFGTLDFLEVSELVSADFTSPEAGFGILGIICLLLFLGAAGKSAQIPLYVWLPDAMAGPTPVSALIHAATMVTAGVYMIARSSALYSRSPDAMLVVASVGVLTALVAALIAVSQRDIKKVLAYSTVSQLGYMFLAVGVGAFSAGIFHLFTHAFFKALLFLGSGSVILALHHEQDMFRMGGLKKYLPFTWATMGIASLAIAGIPPFAGFFSKDEILWKALTGPGGYPILWIIGVAVAGLTAFYMARLMFLTFYGTERFKKSSAGNHDFGQSVPHDPTLYIKIPLFLLAGLSAFAGLLGLPAWLGNNYFEEFLHPSLRYALVSEGHHASHSLEISLTLLVIALVLSGVWIAWYFFLRNPSRREALTTSFRSVNKLLYNKFYVDEIYDLLIIRPLFWLSSTILWKFTDDAAIDGTVNGTASLMKVLSGCARKIQNGYVRGYVTWIITGAVLLFLYVIFVS
jgi:NADH-quinone oxidoreductase subunit L